MRILFISIALIYTGIAWGQEPKLDQLEMYYDQGHYKRVLRKSERLLNKPYYDYSALPEFYAALALFKLTRNENYNQRNPEARDQAKKYFKKFRREDVSGKAYQMHIHEIEELKYYLAQQSLKYENKNMSDRADEYSGMIESMFKGTKSSKEIATQRRKQNVDGNIKESGKNTKKEKKEKRYTGSSTRNEVITYAETFLGTPYRYGSKNPKKGFDCSGYTGHVLKKYDYYIPRSSKNQYKKVDKIKRSKVQKGDLVFFGNPSVHHVGIVHEIMPNGDIKMIHASSSLGISIVNVDQSSYWKPRLKSFGRVIK